MKRNTRGGHLVFQNEAKNSPSQDFVMMNICYKFENYTYNTLCSRGPKKNPCRKSKNARDGHLVFQNEAKNIPRQILRLSIYPVNLRSLPIIPWPLQGLRENLYTLRWRRHTHA